MKLFYLLFFLIYCELLGIGSKSLAQSKLLPARVVKTPGDTLDGFINYYDWKISPEKIEFNKTVDAPTQVLVASEIHSFYLIHKKEWYFSKQLQVAFYRKVYSDTNKKPYRIIDGNYFVQLVSKGNIISLYSFIDTEQTIRFYVEKGPSFLELINYSYSTYTNNKTYTTNVTQYRNQLEILTKDCPSISISSNFSYNEKEILNIINNFHKCLNEKIETSGSDKKGYYPLLTAGYGFMGQDIKIPLSGVGLHIALPKKFYSRYALITLSYIRFQSKKEIDVLSKNYFNLSIFKGKYFGNKDLRPFIHGGFQYPLGLIAIGGGLNYKKNLNLELRSFGFLGVMGSFHYTFGNIKSAK